MLLSALIQDEAFGHVGISPNSGSGLNLRVGEDVSAACIQAAFSSTANTSLVEDKKSVNLCCLENHRKLYSIFPWQWSCSDFAEKLQLFLLSSGSRKILSSRGPPAKKEKS